MTEGPLQCDVWVESEVGAPSHYLPKGTPIHIIHRVGVMTEIECKGNLYLADTDELSAALPDPMTNG